MDKKIKIKCQINDIKINSVGIFSNEIIRFKYKNNQYSFDIKNNILEKNNEYVLNFNKKICTIDSNMEFAIEVLHISKCNKTINIVYKINDDKFNLEFTYEI